MLSSELPELEFQPAQDAEALLAKLPGSELLARSRDFFGAYPPKALLDPVSRSILYLLCRQLKPQVALEVGTFFAGTAEILARALDANGNGHLITVDPYGGDRVPPVLEGWPTALRDRVTFLDCNSMQSFMTAEHNSIAFDLAFIDGDHSYEYALFDLGVTARLANPGAVIVMDNYEQPGVFLATRRFLAKNPGWRELGDGLSGYSEAAPFDALRPSFPGTSFLILQGPSEICITATPVSFQTASLEQPGLRGVEFALDPRHGGGTLHVMTFFRSFWHDLSIGPPEQEQIVSRLELAPGQMEAGLAYAAPFLTVHKPTQSYRKIEFILAWTPRRALEPLRLQRPPAVITME